VEEYLRGPELTVAVLPPGEWTLPDPRRNPFAAPEPSSSRRRRRVATHSALRPILRESGAGGEVMPYSGVVPVEANSRALSAEETAAMVETGALREVQLACERIALRAGATAPIRIDLRGASLRRRDEANLGSWR